MQFVEGYDTNVPVASLAAALCVYSIITITTTNSTVCAGYDRYTYYW